VWETGGYGRRDQKKKSLGDMVKETLRGPKSWGKGGGGEWKGQKVRAGGRWRLHNEHRRVGELTLDRKGVGRMELGKCREGGEKAAHKKWQCEKAGKWVNPEPGKRVVEGNEVKPISGWNETYSRVIQTKQSERVQKSGKA